VTVAPLQPGDASARAGPGCPGGPAEDAVAPVPAVAVGGADPPEVHPAPASNPAAMPTAAVNALTLLTGMRRV
jgi:hypothetical protein